MDGRKRGKCGRRMGERHLGKSVGPGWLHELCRCFTAGNPPLNLSGAIPNLEPKTNPGKRHQPISHAASEKLPLNTRQLLLTSGRRASKSYTPDIHRRCGPARPCMGDEVQSTKDQTNSMTRKANDRNDSLSAIAVLNITLENLEMGFVWDSALQMSGKLCDQGTIAWFIASNACAISNEGFPWTG